MPKARNFGSIVGGMLSTTSDNPDSSQPTPASANRQPSPIDALADEWLETLVNADPSMRVFLGLPGAQDEYADYSPAGHRALAEAASTAAARLAALPLADDIDAVTAKELARTWIDIEDAARARLELRNVNNIESPVQAIRDVFDLMPDTTREDWENISRRLDNVADAVAGYVETLRLGIREGITPARRQVLFAAEQATEWAAEDGFFRSLAARASEIESNPAAVVAELHRSSALAAMSYAQLGEFLANELAPASRTEDGVGREHYVLASRSFLGAEIDLDETYEWGLAQLASIVAEQQAVAEQITPGASIEEAIAHLDSDPERVIHGTNALREWMQQTSDRAVSELGEKHFEIPERIRALECMIAPTQTGGIYYTPPTADLSRPGQMWWSVAPGVTEFTTWRELTTVYHEGVPGHHLQCAQSVISPDLNLWRRSANWISGHGEGWALYAERLMADLGYLDDPGNRMGMLDGQRMRAARVVLDIGVHLGKQRPDGNGTWDYEYALNFMRENATMDEGQLRFEVNRYFGWPGQAPSYSVGQRIWEQLRDDYLARNGGHKTLRDFHKEALALGGVGLDTLRFALSEL